MKLLNEMASLVDDLRVKKSFYSVEIHGATYGGKSERAYPPHIHIYGWLGNKLILNFEISLADILSYSDLILIKYDDGKIKINNREDCSWNNNGRLYRLLKELLFNKPPYKSKYNNCVDYIDAAIKIWNRETDPRTLGKNYSLVPEKYRIIVAMYEMKQDISEENKRKYFKGYDFDKIIKTYCK